MRATLRVRLFVLLVAICGFGCANLWGFQDLGPGSEDAGGDSTAPTGDGQASLGPDGGAAVDGQGPADSGADQSIVDGATGPDSAMAFDGSCPDDCASGCCTNGVCVSGTAGSVCGVASNGSCGQCVGSQSCGGGTCNGGWTQLVPPADAGSDSSIFGSTWQLHNLGLGTIWGSGPGDLYVLDFSYGSPPGQAVDHYRTANGWARETLPAFDDDFLFLDVSGSGPGDIYAVGGDSVPLDGGVGGVVYHSNGGASWTPQTVPPAIIWLSSVWGSSANNVYAVGQGTASNCAILHSSGDGSWETQAVPLTCPYGGLYSVWGSGPSDVYAVGGPLILHSTDGQTWNVEYNAAAGDAGTQGPAFLVVWGSGPQDVYVGGGSGNMHSTGGGSWAAWNAPNALDEVVTIWGSGPNDVYMGERTSGVFHSTGSNDWTEIDDYECGEPVSIWGSGSGNVFASCSGESNSLWAVP